LNPTVEVVVSKFSPTVFGIDGGGDVTVFVVFSGGGGGSGAIEGGDGAGFTS
jgi:hypothetical protein